MNEFTHKISIVVPIFNSEDFLRPCLDSLIAQKPLPSGWGYEVILINDGSTDKSKEICEGYVRNNQPIFRLIDQNNMGLADARNKGIREAKGDFLLFVDSDDALGPLALNVLAAAQERTLSDVVVGDFVPVASLPRLVGTNEGDPSIEMVSSVEALNKTHDHINGVAWVTAWNKLFRATLFDRIMFPKGFRRFEDEATTPFLYNLADTICHVKAVTYFYLLRSTGNSQLRGPDYFPNALRGSKMLVQLYKSVGIKDLLAYWVWNYYIFWSGCKFQRCLSKSELAEEKAILKSRIKPSYVKSLPMAKKAFLYYFRITGSSLYVRLGMIKHIARHIR